MSDYVAQQVDVTAEELEHAVDVTDGVLKTDITHAIDVSKLISIISAATTLENLSDGVYYKESGVNLTFKERITRTSGSSTTTSDRTTIIQGEAYILKSDNIITLITCGNAYAMTRVDVNTYSADILKRTQSELIAGENITLETRLNDGKVVISATGGGGGGGTSDYNDLDNKPKINNITLSGNKSLSDLGIAPAFNVGENLSLSNGTLSGNTLKFTTVQSKPANPDLNTIYGIVAGELFPDVSDYITTDYPYIAVVKDGSNWKLVQFKTQDMWGYYGSARSLDYAVRTLVNGEWGEATEYTESDSWSEIFHLSGVDPAYYPTETNARLKEYIYYSNSNWYCQNRGSRYTPTGTPNDNKTDVYGVPIDPSLIDRRVLRCWKHNSTDWVDLGLVDYSEMFDDIYNKGEVDTALSGKQDTLVNQSNIKSINGTSLLGSGDMYVQPVTATATITDNSTTALADNTEYSGTNLSTVTFTYPQGDFECYMSLSFASSGTITVTFPTSQYIGSVPTFANGETWEISIKNGVIVAGKVDSGA